MTGDLGLLVIDEAVPPPLGGPLTVAAVASGE
jgi:hypothetical protein